jgi:hypothetical protein
VTNQLEIIRADNVFRYGKKALPPEEAAELWDVFSRETDRLYAIMNEGQGAGPRRLTGSRWNPAQPTPDFLHVWTVRQLPAR